MTPWLTRRVGGKKFSSTPSGGPSRSGRGASTCVAGCARRNERVHVVPVGELCQRLQAERGTPPGKDGGAFPRRNVGQVRRLRRGRLGRRSSRLSEKHLGGTGPGRSGREEGGAARKTDVRRSWPPGAIRRHGSRPPGPEAVPRHGTGPAGRGLVAGRRSPPGWPKLAGACPPVFFRRAVRPPSKGAPGALRAGVSGLLETSRPKMNRKSPLRLLQPLEEISARPLLDA